MENKGEKIMLVNDFQTKFANEIKKGEFVKASWKSEKVINGDLYEKVSNGVVRFVKYGNINGVQVKGKTNPNEQVIIPNVLFHNTNTNNYLVQMATTNVKAKCTYKINGVEVDKATYETMVKPRQNNGETIVFRVKVENLLSLGE